jgi:hypothetical protein
VPLQDRSTVAVAGNIIRRAHLGFRSPASEAPKWAARDQSCFDPIAFVLRRYWEEQVPIREKSYYAIISLTEEPHACAVRGSNQPDSGFVDLGISIGITNLQVQDYKCNGGESGIRTLLRPMAP